MTPASLIGKTLVARKPFRIGMGRGPNKDGLCGVGDRFPILHAEVDWHVGFELQIGHPDGGSSYTVLDNEYHEVQP